MRPQTAAAGSAADSDWPAYGRAHEGSSSRDQNPTTRGAIVPLAFSRQKMVRRAASPLALLFLKKKKGKNLCLVLSGSSIRNRKFAPCAACSNVSLDRSAIASAPPRAKDSAPGWAAGRGARQYDALKHSPSPEVRSNRTARTVLSVRRANRSFRPCTRFRNGQRAIEGGPLPGAGCPRPGCRPRGGRQPAPTISPTSSEVVQEPR
ncbi:hypothetical protein LMG28138_04916 [Pararobbsia alpina]|uniref:Uncharacterized protein n=1 Tax=Pararobbsia alpina TaxID=621374 RepID=A0A6S7C3U6_9BURK|nr:hypothetical protein LMG28138_04916 [Pararobbsia alpina]